MVVIIINFRFTVRIATEETFSVSFSLFEIPETEHFVARQEELLEMHKTLSGDGSRRTVVLHGLGGIGKTQLAVEYAKRHRNDYSATFWFNSKDEDSLKQSFAKIARQILREHSSASRLSAVNITENLDDVVETVKGWLSLPKNNRWLAIYDNYDNPKVSGNADPRAFDIRKFLPEVHQGAVVITTRLAEVKLGRRIRIGRLEDVKDSLEVLSYTSGRESVIDGKLYSAVMNVELIVPRSWCCGACSGVERPSSCSGYGRRIFGPSINKFL